MSILKRVCNDWLQHKIKTFGRFKISFCRDPVGHWHNELFVCSWLQYFLVCLLYLTLGDRLPPYKTPCLLKGFVFNNVTLYARGAVLDLLRSDHSDSLTNKVGKREGFVFSRIKLGFGFTVFFMQLPRTDNRRASTANTRRKGAVPKGRKTNLESLDSFKSGNMPHYSPSWQHSPSDRQSGHRH